MRSIIITFQILLLLYTNLFAQWSKIDVIPTQEMVALAAGNDTIFAATVTNQLYRSIDGGLNWNTITLDDQSVEIFSMKIIGNQIFVGTYNHGVFSSADGGESWIHSNRIYFPVSGFAMHGNNMYLSIMGDGVYNCNQNTNVWQPMNNALPSYSHNVGAIVSTSTELLIGAGGNGTFYNYDFEADQWIEHFYYGSILPGLQIDAMICHADTLWAVNGQRIIRSNDGRLNWLDDKQDTHNGYTRIIYRGTDNYYTLTNLVAGGTWIQERDNQANGGESWNTGEEFLPGGYSYDILEFQDKLFLANSDGLYFKNLVSGIDSHINETDGVRLIPNPNNGKVIHVISNQVVAIISIMKSTGQIIFTENKGQTEFMVYPELAPGIYFIRMYLASGLAITRKFIVT
jgi:hypothetical protein